MKKLPHNRNICLGDRGIGSQISFDKNIYKGVPPKNLRKRTRICSQKKEKIMNRLNLQAEINKKIIEKYEKSLKQD
jgi:hypothetical protein